MQPMCLTLSREVPNEAFGKAQCPIIERLTNCLMMHGRNNGKKLMAVRIVKHAMEIIHLLTENNPIQVIVDAIINRFSEACIYSVDDANLSKLFKHSYAIKKKDEIERVAKANR
ncbi:small ribosomal subunit protein uS7-like [Silene latifolia]|uniref:small ribosomal subunit protein uS7-like n=1 Tax=Silene latifolia TaxID=37657 RepID=UPI003D785C06